MIHELISERKSIRAFAGKEIDAEMLQRELGVSVIPVDGRLGGGVHELVAEIQRSLNKAGATARVEPKLAAWTSNETETTLRHTAEVPAFDCFN